MVALIGVAVSWGISFVVIKNAVATLAPADVVGWRFGIATLALVAVRPRTVMIITGRTLRSGVVLGSLLGLGFLLCAQGMRSTSVVTSAFIVGTTVVFAPLVSLLWFRRRPTRRTAGASLLAAAGLALLTLHGAAVGPGAVLILLAALLWAVHLCALERWVRPDQVYGSALIQLATAALLAFAVGAATGSPAGLPQLADGWVFLGLLYLGLVATAAAFVALTWAQTRTDATTTAVLLTLEPVVGAAAAIALGEPVTAAAVGGALAVLAASGLVALAPPVGPVTEDVDHVRPRSRARLRPATGRPA